MATHETVLTLVSALHANIDSIYTTLQSLSSHPTHEAELQRLATEREARIFDLRTEHAQALQILANQRLREQQDIELKRQREADELEEQRKQEWKEVLKRREQEDQERERKIQEEELEREKEKRKEDECREAERESRELILAEDIEKELERVEDEIETRIEEGKKALKKLDEKRRAINTEIDKALNMPTVIPEIRYRSRTRTLSRTGILEAVTLPPRAPNVPDVQPKNIAIQASDSGVIPDRNDEKGELDGLRTPELINARLQENNVSSTTRRNSGLRTFGLGLRSISPDSTRKPAGNRELRAMPGPKEKFPDLNQSYSESEQKSPGNVSPGTQTTVLNISLGAPLSIHTRELDLGANLPSTSDPMIARLFKYHDPMTGRLFTYMRYPEAKQTSSAIISPSEPMSPKNLPIESPIVLPTEERSSRSRPTECHDPMIARLFKPYDPMIDRLFSDNSSDIKQSDSIKEIWFTRLSSTTKDEALREDEQPASTLCAGEAHSGARSNDTFDPMIDRLFRWNPMIDRLFRSDSSEIKHANSATDILVAPQLSTQDKVLARETVDEQPRTIRSASTPSIKFHDPMIDRLFKVYDPMIDRLFQDTPSELKQKDNTTTSPPTLLSSTTDMALGQEVKIGEQSQKIRPKTSPPMKFSDPMIDRLFQHYDPMIERLSRDNLSETNYADRLEHNPLVHEMKAETSNRSWEAFISENFGTPMKERTKSADVSESAQMTPVASSDDLVRLELESQETMLFGERHLVLPRNSSCPVASREPSTTITHDDPTGFAERARAVNAASRHVDSEPWPLRDEEDQDPIHGATANVHTRELHASQIVLSDSSDYWSRSETESEDSDDEAEPGQHFGSLRAHAIEMIEEDDLLPDNLSDTNTIGNDSYENMSFEEKYGVPRSSTPIRSYSRIDSHTESSHTTQAAGDFFHGESDSGDEIHPDYGAQDSYPDNIADQYLQRIEPALEIVPEHEPLTEFNDTYTSHRNSGIFSNLVDTFRNDFPAVPQAQFDNHQPGSEYALGNAARIRAVSFDDDYPEYIGVESSQHETTLHVPNHIADTVPSFEIDAHSDSIPTTPSDTSSSSFVDTIDNEPVIKNASRDRGMTVSSQPADDLSVYTAKEQSFDPNFANAYTSFVASSPGFPPIGEASHDLVDLDERPGSGYSSFGEQTGMKVHRDKISSAKGNDAVPLDDISFNGEAQKAIVPGSTQNPAWSTEWNGPVLESNETPTSGSPFQPTRTLPRTPVLLSINSQSTISPTPSSSLPSPSPSPKNRRPAPPIPSTTGSLFVKTRSVFESASPQGSPAIVPSPITAFSAVRHDSPPPPAHRRSVGSRPSSLHITEPANHDSPAEKETVIEPEEDLDEEAFMPKSLDGNNKPPSPVFAHGRSGSDSSLSKETNGPVVQKKKSTPFLHTLSRIVGGTQNHGLEEDSVHNFVREPLLARNDEQ
ncbi:uncharacterized protein RAG0_00135 [Rhynchosporium agropyri]|uniref:Uncharacterized protein n=1 Tax=Rhynchosporium agropyri TaxID=914238 RepID=A0A1E1JRX3_9HELO|nr:uncharacterized protein RAG0_00135 [Rhynchosporium agropyri]